MICNVIFPDFPVTGVELIMANNVEVVDRLNEGMLSTVYSMRCMVTSG